jgi:ATP-binding cassette, subfamily C, bacterial CydC
MKDVLRILGLWRGRAIWLVAGTIVSLAALLAGIGMMALGGTMVALAVATGVLVAPMALRVFGMARVLLRYFERLLTHDATFRALADLRIWFFRGIARSTAGGLGFRQAGDVLSRLVADIESLDGIYLRILVPLIGAVLLLPVIVVQIGVYSIPLAIGVGLLFAVAAFVMPWIGARIATQTGMALADATGALRIAALDALTGLREVRAFGAEGRMLATVQAREATLLAAQRELASKSSVANAAALLCGQGALLLVLITAGVQPVASVIALFLLVAAFEATGGLPRAGVLAGHAAAAAHRVLEAAEAPVPVPDPAHVAAVPAGSALRFETVHFRWLPERPLVFDGLSLEVPQGARVALLGASGAGKSTLAALALKVAAPQQGRVLIGNVDLSSLAAADVRRQIAWLSQATHLFDDTIRANLLLARPDADSNALWAALDGARIGEMVRALPNGLDTWVGEGGARFSGGQARRLVLARALLSPAPILILDEPCAGLDAETERAFLSTLNDVAEGRSVILITHRLTGVERLDRIWRLAAGKAVAAAG